MSDVACDKKLTLGTEGHCPLNYNCNNIVEMASCSIMLFLSYFMVSFTGKRLQVSRCLTQKQQQTWNGTFDSAWKAILVVCTFLASCMCSCCGLRNVYILVIFTVRCPIVWIIVMEMFVSMFIAE